MATITQNTEWKLLSLAFLSIYVCMLTHMVSLSHIHILSHTYEYDVHALTQIRTHICPPLALQYAACQHLEVEN